MLSDLSRQVNSGEYRAYRFSSGSESRARATNRVSFCATIAWAVWAKPVVEVRKASSEARSLTRLRLLAERLSSTLSSAGEVRATLFDRSASPAMSAPTVGRDGLSLVR